MKEKYLLVLLTLFSHVVFSNPNPVITGPTSVTVGQVATYTYGYGAPTSHSDWGTDNNLGSTSSPSNNGSIYSIVVTWGAPGTDNLNFSVNGTVLASVGITISCPSVPTPSTTFIYPNGTTFCGSSTTIYYSDDPPAGVRWFWQTSDGGTSKANDASSFTITASGIYYLRANCGSTWSTGSLATASIIPKLIPTVSGSDQTICTGDTTAIVLTNNVDGTVNTWTASADSNVTGSSSSNGASPALPPYTYKLAQHLSLTDTSAGTVRYTITPSANGCTGSPITVNAVVQPPPIAAASYHNIFSTQRTHIVLSNPNHVGAVTYNWIATPTGVSGTAAGVATHANVISQMLTTTGSTDGSAMYTITPAANGCNGDSITVTISVFLFPVITAPQNYVAKGKGVLLDVGPEYYSTYAWKDSAGTLLDTTKTHSATFAGTYTATVTKLGATATAAYTLLSQFSGLNMNYIITNTPLKAMTDSTGINNQLVDSVTQSIVYFDGLGRPFQTVITQGSPQQQDLVTPVQYDKYDLVPRKYLPVTIESTGRYKSGLLTNGSYTNPLLNYNNGTGDKITDDSVAFSKTVFEQSPLQRPLKDYGPGQIWRDNNKSVNHSYEVNDSLDVLLFTYDPTTTLTFTGSSGQPSYYGKGQLYATRTTDEHGNDVIEYTDKLGRTVCKKVQYATDSSSNKLYAATYYVYDNLGNLMVVLPPEAIRQGLSALTGN